MEVKNNELFWAKVKPNAIIPTKRDEDAGYDIYACFDEDYIVIPFGSTVRVPTGVAVAVSQNYYLNAAERGSTGSIGLKYSAGIIDSGFRGEISIFLTNTGYKNIIISKLTTEELIEKYSVTDGYGSVNIPNKNDGVVCLSFNYQDDVNWSSIIYPYEKAIAQLIVHSVHKMEEKEIDYNELIEIPSVRGTGMLGSSNK